MFNELIERTFIDAPIPHKGIMTISDKAGLGLELNYKELTPYGSI